MNQFYRRIVRPLLFKIDPEKAHELSMSLLQRGVYHLYKTHFIEPREVFKLEFKNPIGIAAGFDKDGKYLKSLAEMGFGHIEAGTVTPRPQKGNPKPRLFRLPKDKALINRMGFNNEGAEALARRLDNYRDRSVVIGGNIGKNKSTPNEDALMDYRKCIEILKDRVDYYTINISSPNTPGLRDLQDKKYLGPLLEGIMEIIEKDQLQTPVLLKISPDVNEIQLDEILSTILKCNISGIIINNTTSSRKDLKSRGKHLKDIGEGGLSGLPLCSRSRYLLKRAGEENIPIVNVGGIMNPKEADHRLNNGASLVQIYTGFIYYGPSFIRGLQKVRRDTSVFST